MNLYEIAGQILALNIEPQYIHKNMKAFQCDTNKKADLTFDFQEEVIPQKPETQPLIHTNYFSVYSTESGYLLLYANSGNVSACSYEEQTHHSIIYLTHTSDKDLFTEITTLTSGTRLNTIDFIFFTIRDIFFLWIQQKHMLAIHSSSLIYKDKAYLFSASSGTGKTTHTNMWVERFQVDILDGDVAVICLEDDIPIAYGLPWCGTSEKFLNRKVPLGGIIFLAQGCHNSICNLTFFEAVLRCAARCFTPTWTKDLATLNLNTAEELVPKILCCFFECLPNQDAVDMIKNYIDSRQ